MRNNVIFSFSLLCLLGWLAQQVVAEAQNHNVTTQQPASTLANLIESTKAPTTTTLASEAEDEEAVTSTIETIGVADEDTTNSPIATTLSPSDLNDNAPAAPLETLEGRSIATGVSAAASENALNKPDEHSGKLVAAASTEGNDATVITDEDEDDESSNNSSATVTPSPAASEATNTASRRERPNKQMSHLNLTKIDLLYVEGRKDEQETVQSWQRMAKKLKKGIGSVIGSIVPHALNMSQEAKISGNCSGAMLKWVLSMNQLKSWALRMLDASGKPIAGLLEGSLTMFGNYRQCLKIRAPEDDEIEFAGEFREYFRGKYCIIQAKPWLPAKSQFYNLNTKLKSLTQSEDDEERAWYDKTVFDELSELALAFNFVNIRMDLCVPSVCSREDIQKAVEFLLRGIDMKSRVLRCETDPQEGGLNGGSIVESGPGNVAMLALDASSTPGGFMDSYGPVNWVLVPLIAVSLVLLATGTSFAIGGRQKKYRDGNKLTRAIHSLALKRSIDGHLNVDYDQLADDKPLSLYGIRFILVLWIILVESAINLRFEYLRELLMLKDLIFWWPMQFIINSTFQYESIILLTAFTMGYKNCLNSCSSNAKSLIRFVLDKYIRLMPSIMLTVAFVILLPLAYKGPVWNDYVTKQSTVCQATGWLNMIFLQNYLPYQDMCLPQTWLICVELQLVLLMAPVVYYLNKNYMNTKTNSNNYNNSNGNRHRIQNGRSSNCNSNPDRLFFWIRTIPGATLIGCIVIGLASSFFNVYSNQLPPIWLYTMADPDSKAIYYSKHMMRLWTHLAVFAMGILAGLECRRLNRSVTRSYRGDNLQMMSHGPNLRGQKSQAMSSSSLPVISTQKDEVISSKSHNDLMNNSNISIDFQTSDSSNEHINGSESKLNNIMEEREDTDHNSSHRLGSALLEGLGFVVAIAIMAAIIFSTHDWALYDLPQPIVAGLYDVGSRFFWSVASIWILYMVSVPGRDRKFSLISKLLGHPAMVFLGKLSFLIYMIHPVVHITVLAIQEQPIYSSWLMMFHILVGNMTITVILASLVSLFVEMPCRNLFRRCGTSLLLTHDVGSGLSTSTTNSANTGSASTIGFGASRFR